MKFRLEYFNRNRTSQIETKQETKVWVRLQKNNKLKINKTIKNRNREKRTD